MKEAETKFATGLYVPCFSKMAQNLKSDLAHGF